MSLSISRDDRAKEVLDLCLSSESPEMQSRVYEIIHKSGLQPNDPLFLVLALTGQMRVFLEAAPKELNQLLDEWKNQNASSLAEISKAVALVKQTQAEQAEIASHDLTRISQKCVADFREAGMTTVGAIADANNETLEQVQQVKKQNEELLKKIEILQLEVKKDKEKTLENKKAFAEFVGKTTSDLSLTQERVNLSYSDIKKLQDKTIWLKWADWFAPLSALAIVGGAGLLVGGGLMFQRYNTATAKLGLDIGKWNLDRIVKCQGDNNPKCTLWIVPPNSLERGE